MAKVMQGFERESAKMDMTGEMMEDTLDDVLGDSEDEEESNQVIIIVSIILCIIHYTLYIVHYTLYDPLLIRNVQYGS